MGQWGASSTKVYYYGLEGKIGSQQKDYVEAKSIIVQAETPEKSSDTLKAFMGLSAQPPLTKDLKSLLNAILHIISRYWVSLRVLFVNCLEMQFITLTRVEI